MAKPLEILKYNIHSRERHPSRLYLYRTLIVVAVLLSGCASPFSGNKVRQQVKGPAPAPAPVVREPEEKIARLQLHLLEKEAQRKALEKKLEEATLEVVRTKEKLRSLESRAEAASTLAEGEIALKALRTKAPALQKDPEILQAEEFLRASNQELERQNYGGALYLATRAKVIINEGRERSKEMEKTPLMADEVSFAIPLPLRVTGTSNVREGPGLDSKVLFSLQNGSALVGYSYKGLWVRVGTGDGRGGWVHYSLVGGQ